jgi:hypothetical protein
MKAMERAGRAVMRLTCIRKVGFSVRNAYKILVGRPEGKSSLEDIGIDGRIILKWITKKYNTRVWTELIWYRVGSICGLL